MSAHNYAKITSTIIDESRISIKSEHTCFVSLFNSERVVNYSKGDLLKKYNQLRHLAKKMDVSIKYKHNFLAFIKHLEAHLFDFIDTYNETYKELCKKWQNKVSKGITIPFVDDEEYHDLCKLSDSFNSNYDNNKPIGQFLNLDVRFDDLIEAIKSKDDNSTMTIHL
tara:strand:- start:1890 stop:2390 length:501 start_codon:yes stop_codon:yes gene_type:complete